jgi:hypothetical protein
LDGLDAIEKEREAVLSCADSFVLPGETGSRVIEDNFTALFLEVTEAPEVALNE